MADDRKKTSGKDAGGAWQNEGEGSRSGARAYDQATEKFG